MERNKVTRRLGWANLPHDLLINIFTRIPDWINLSQVCLNWNLAVLSLPRPVVLCPLTDCPMQHPLPFPPVAVQLLVPSIGTTAPRFRGVAASSSISEAEGKVFVYHTVPLLPISSDIRLIGGSSALPLFVNDACNVLVIPRVGSPLQLGWTDEAALVLDLPYGVDGEDIYMGGLAVSTRNDDASYQLLHISVIVIGTLSTLFSMRPARHGKRWSALPVTEPAEGHSFELNGRRTFVNILCTGDISYLLEASRRLCLLIWDVVRGLELQELPIQGGPNALLGIHSLKRTWLMQLPRCDLQGMDLVCLGYLWQDQHHFGQFVAFDFAEEEDTKLWLKRNGKLGDLCVLLGWGPVPIAVVYDCPAMIGLHSGMIYDSHIGLRSYKLGWNIWDALTIPDCWPCPLWLNPEFPSPISLADTLVRTIVEECAHTLLESSSEDGNPDSDEEPANATPKCSNDNGNPDADEKPAATNDVDKKKEADATLKSSNDDGNPDADEKLAATNDVDKKKEADLIGSVELGARVNALSSMVAVPQASGTASASLLEQLLTRTLEMLYSSFD